MSLSHEHIGSKISAKIKIYILSSAELLCTLCNEIPCIYIVINWQFFPSIFRSERSCQIKYAQEWVQKAHKRNFKFGKRLSRLLETFALCYVWSTSQSIPGLFLTFHVSLFKFYPEFIRTLSKLRSR